jgi:hypothetical protein
MILTNDVVLSQQARTFQLQTDADALLGGNTAARQQERDRLRDEIRQLFDPIKDERAGIVLTFGTAPSPAEGGQLSQEINQLLKSTMPDVFGNAVMRDFHSIEANRQLRGLIEFEVYVIIGGR